MQHMTNKLNYKYYMIEETQAATTNKLVISRWLHCIRLPSINVL